MVRKEDVEFYCSFTRKELQSLCKKYSLPANRSSSDMAESLASYFEKNSLNSVAFDVGHGGVHGHSAAAALVAPMRPGSPTSGTRDLKKDSYGNKLATNREDLLQLTKVRESGCTPGDKMHYQELDGGLIGSPFTSWFNRDLNEKGLMVNSEMDFRPRLDYWLENGSQAQIKQVNTGEHPQETPSPGCSTIYRSSSFEFYVSSEEGINLSVDLNFNPSDWINTLRNGVSVCDSMWRKRSRISDQGIDYHTESKKQKSQSPLNIDAAARGRDDHAVNPLNLALNENSRTPSGYQCSGEGSLASSAVEPCSRIKDLSDNWKNDRRLNLSLPDSSAPGQIASCSESCNKSCCVVSLDLDCVNSPEKKLAIVCVSDAAERPVNLDTLDHPTSNLHNEFSENPSPESPQKVGNSSTVTPICPGGGGSEISSSEAKSYWPNPPCSPCKTSQSWNPSDSKLIVDAEPNGYPNLIKFGSDVSKNSLPSNAEEQEKSEIISGQEQEQEQERSE